MTEFRVLFESAAERWTASVVQTEGVPVLPAHTPVFMGRSLASVEEQMSRYLDELDIRFFYVVHDWGSSLSEHQAQLLHAALQAIAEAKLAEIRRVRHSYKAISALSGFSLRDISVLLGEEVSAIERTLDVGKLFGEIEHRATGSVQPGPLSPSGLTPSSAS